MADGSFEYELKLPRPEESGDKDKIAYAESLDQLDQAEEINPELRQDEQLVARGLDHFTIFVVVSPLPGGTNNGDACTVASIDGTCYDTLQAAIDNAIASDTIEVAGDLSLTHQVDVNKSVSINGNGHTIQAAFAKTGNDNNAALGIFADNVTLANLTLDGFLGTQLHGVNAYVSQNILLDGVSLLNFPYAGMIVNGSTVTVNNISTSGNGWGGINIDQGGGVTSAAQLTVNGYSSHSDSTHIWMDDITKNVTLVDTLSQYSYTDYGNARVFTLQDIIAPSTPTGIKIFDHTGQLLGCGGYTNNRSITIDWDDNAASEGVSYYQLDIIDKDDHKHVTPSKYNATIRDTDGLYQYRIRAVDAAGNKSAPTDWCQLTLDRSQPVVSWDAPPNGAMLKAPVNLQAHANETLNDLTFNWQLVGDSWGVGQNLTDKKTAYAWDFTPSTDGVYNLRASGRDLALNSGQASDIQVTIDNTPPKGSIAAPVNGSYAVGKITVSGQVSDNLSGLDRVEVRLRNSPGNTYRTAWEVATLDGSGNYTFQIDTATIPDDVYEVVVVAYDKVGNSKWLYPRPIITVDNTAPATPTNLHREGKDGNLYQCSQYSLRQNMVPVWDANSESDFDHYEYSSFNAGGGQGLDEKILTVAKLANTWVAPNDGTYGFAVRAVDKAGNKSSWALSDESLAGSCQITYDSTPPTTPSILGFKNPSLNCSDITNAHSATVDWTDADDAGVGFDKYEYNVDYPKPDGSRGQWTTYFTNSQYGGSFNEGEHIIKVRAIDKLGNSSDWSKTCTITTDWTAPDLTIDALKYSDGTVEPNKFITNDNTPLILGTTSTDAVSVDVNVDGTTYAAAISGTDWQADVTNVLADGTYTIKVTSTDAAGNKTSKEQNITIDTILPKASYQYYQDATAIDGSVLAYVKDVDQLGFMGDYVDASPSSNLYWDSYVIFEAQADGSFDFDNNGAQALCNWRTSPNLLDLSSLMVDNYTATTESAFANCTASAAEGEYYLAHQLYDFATNQDQPSINQYRDILGLHFIVDRTAPKITADVSPVDPDGENGWYRTQPEVTLTATDDRAVDYIEYHWDADSWSTYSAPVTASEGTHTLYYRAYDLAGNVSVEGSVKLYFDQTSPDPEPKNLRITSLALPSGRLEWDASDDATSGLSKYEVSWKLKGNDQLSFGDVVSPTTLLYDLKNLQDGEWEIRVKAVDYAGNWTETLMLYTIGGGTGTAGETTVTTSATTTTAAQATGGTGGQVLGIQTEEPSQIEEQSKTDLNTSKIEAEQGEVLGATQTCSNFQYWPILLLVLLALLVFCLSLFTNWTVVTKHVSSLVLTLLAISIYWLMRRWNIDCIGEDRFLQLVHQYFLAWAALAALLARGLGFYGLDRD